MRESLHIKNLSSTLHQVNNHEIGSGLDRLGICSIGLLDSTLPTWKEGTNKTSKGSETLTHVKKTTKESEYNI